MLFEMAFTLTAVAVMLELVLVYRYRLLLELFARNTLLGMAFSLVLSWVIGTAFEATGLTVFVPAVASTLVTLAVYKSGALVSVRELMAEFAR